MEFGAKAVIGAIILIIALFPIYWLVLIGNPSGKQEYGGDLPDLPKILHLNILDSFFRKKDLMLH